MIKYIIKRLILLVLALAIIISITFFLMDLMPGYPSALNGLDDPNVGKGPSVSTQNLWKVYLDLPVLTRFMDFVKGIFVGNHTTTLHLTNGTATTIELGRFGTIFSPNQAASSTDLMAAFFTPLRFSLMVTIPAFIISTVTGITLGFIAGYKRGKWQDTFINIFVMLFVAIPSFVLAILFMILGKFWDLPIAFDNTLGFWYEIKSLIIPILVLALGGIAILTYYTRNEVVEILKSDFISIAQSKGLSKMQVWRRHVLRNCSIPLVSIILPSFVTLLTGSFIVEIFFAVPGISKLIVDAVAGKEIYIIEFSILFFTSLSLLIALLVDVIYVIIDPRIKIASAQKMSLYKRIKLSKNRRSNFIKTTRKEVKQ